jgi:hypothetical protein
MLWNRCERMLPRRLAPNLAAGAQTLTTSCRSCVLPARLRSAALPPAGISVPAAHLCLRFTAGNI